MADVTVKATLSGFDEVHRRIGELTKSMGSLTDAQQEEMRVLQGLANVHNERVALLKKQADALNTVKGLTKEQLREVTEKFNEQERAAQSAKSALGRMASGMMSYATSAFTVTALVGGLVKGLKDVDAAGRESAASSLKLNAMLAATGGVVGVTQHQLEEMAEAMAAATRFDDTGIKNAQSIMLTFSNVTGDVFKRSMALAADYSELMGVDLPSSARILGRAFNDPVNGMGMLSRAIGQLDPETKELIKTFHESGDTLRAQTTLAEALEKRFGGLATTMGGSAVVAVDKLKNAWSNLMQELAKTPDDPTGSKGLFGENMATAAKRIGTITGWISDFGEWRHKNEVRILQEIAKDEAASFQERAAAQRRLTEITKNEGMNRVKNEAEAKEKEKANRKRMDEEALWAQVALDDKLADEWRQKQSEKAKAAAAEEVEHRRLVRETLDFAVKERQIDLEDYLAFIDAQLNADRVGEGERITLLKERRNVTEEIFKRETELQKEKDELLKEEQKEQKELQDVVAERAKEEIAHLETLNIQNGNLVKMEGDERIEALQKLAEKYAAVGSAGVGAYLEIQREIRRTRTTAEQDFDRMRQVFGRTTFDMVGQFSSFHKSVQSNLADIMRGNQSTADGIKGIFKSMVDSVINEFARLAANDILSGVMQLFGLSSGRTGGSLLGGLLGGGGRSDGGGGVGLGDVNTVRNLFNGIGSAADFAGGYAAIEGLSAAEAAALIESGTVGFAGAGMESAALGMGLAEGAAQFIPYVGWAMLAAKALGIDVGSVFSDVVGGVGDVVSGVGDVVGDIFGGIGDVFGFATGGESVVTRPTLFRAGETGAERVRVSPLTGGADMGGGITNVFQGPVIMDEYSMRMWTRRQERLALSLRTAHR